MAGGMVGSFTWGKENSKTPNTSNWGKENSKTPNTSNFQLRFLTE